MYHIMLKSKIYDAIVTSVNRRCEGSISIPKDVMEYVDILPYEQVHVLNVTNGERFITYAKEGEIGRIDILGAASNLCKPRDKLIILTYALIGKDDWSTYNVKTVKLCKNKALFREIQ